MSSTSPSAGVGRKDLDIARLRFRLLSECRLVGLHCLGNVPVLTELTLEVAANRSDGEDGGVGQEVIQRLLLNGVDVDSAGVPVDGKIQLSILVVANSAASHVVIRNAATLVATRADYSHRILFRLLPIEEEKQPLQCTDHTLSVSFPMLFHRLRKESVDSFDGETK